MRRAIVAGVILVLLTGILNCTPPPVQKEWDTAVESYQTINNSIPFYSDLVKEAPWIKLPDKPDWLRSATISSSGVLAEKSGSSTVVVAKGPSQTMSIELRRQETGGLIVCRGGSQDFQMGITRDPQGNTETVTMQAGKSTRTVTWNVKDGQTYFTANVDGEVFSALWPGEQPGLDFYQKFIAWLTKIGKQGGLIASSDRPLMFLAVGKLMEQPPYNGHISLMGLPAGKTTGKAVISDILGGLFGTIGYLAI